MIVIFGDSITAGQHLVDDSKAWPRLLDGRDIYVRGVPGDTTRLALERFPKDVQQIEPDAVVIQFGHNDANRWRTDRGLPRVSPAAFRANLVEMIDRSRAFDVRPVLCSLTPSKRNIQHEQDTEMYDRIVRSVADAEHVALCDVRAAFLAHDSEAALLLPDGLHLSEAGHRGYAKAVQKVLDRESIR